MSINLEDIDKLNRRERQQFETWCREYMNREYHRNLRERAIARQRAELGEEDYEYLTSTMESGRP